MTAVLLRRSALVCAVLGLLDAAYLTFEHFTSSTTLACSENGIVDCAKVTTSSYAAFLGVPVALLGLVYFVVMTVLCLPALYRVDAPVVGWARIAGAVLGVAMVVYLVWVELFALDAICLWCTGIHVLTVLLFIAVLFEAAAAEPLLGGEGRGV